MDRDKIDQQIQSAKVREGPILKRSRFLKQWRERWIVLTFNYMITFTNKTYKEVTDIMDIRTIKSYKSYVSKSQEMIPASFKLRSGDTAFYLCAKSVEEKWSWIVSIERLLDYKQSGPTTYNNLNFLKTKGFPSQQDFINHPQSCIQGLNQQIKTAEKKKQDLEKESIQVAQKIFKEKLQIQKEREKLKQQYKELYRFRQTLQTQQTQQKSFMKQQVQSRQTMQQTPKTFQTRQQETPKTLEVRHVSENKKQIMKGIFDQLKPQSDQFFGFRYYLDFMVNVCSDKRLCFQSPLIQNCQNHANNKNFAKIFVEFLWQYQPTTMNQSIDGRSSTQIFSIALLSREMQYFQNWMKFINLLLKNQLKIFTQDHYNKIVKKLKNFLLHDQSDSTEDVKIILQCIKKMNSIVKIDKGQISARLQKIVKLSKKQDISILAKELLAQL